MKKTRTPLTYEEWRLYGYQVVKGQKATGRNSKGKATFTIDQVYYIDYYEPCEHEYEDDWMFMDPDMGDR